MRLNLALSLILLVSLSSALYPYAEEDHIINLGAPTFNTAVSEFPNGLLIYYYEPLCYPCRVMWPELVATAKMLFDAGSEVRIAKVECHDEVKLCDERSVTTFPTIQLLRNGKPIIEYRGPRTQTEMFSWLRKIVDSKYRDAGSIKETFRSHTNVLVLKNANSNDMKAVYKDFVDDIDVVVADSDEWRGKITNDGILASSSGFVRQIGGADDGKKAIKNAFEKHELVPDLNAAIGSSIQTVKEGKYLFYLRGSDFDPSAKSVQAFKDAASTGIEKNLKPMFASVGMDFLATTIAKLFGADEKKGDTVGILEKKGGVFKKYILEKEITAENIKSFIQDYTNGKTKRYYMSAPAPAKQKNVRQMVGSTFYETLKNEKANGFILFYYPWCEECVKLEPTWNSLGYRLRNAEDVIIGKVDVSENDVEGVDIEEFPTIIYFPTGDRPYEVYKDSRNIKSLTKFLIKKVDHLRYNDDL